MLSLPLMSHLDTLAHVGSPGTDTVDLGICSLGPVKCQGTTDTKREGLVWLCHQPQPNSKGPQVL